jgi:amino acid adenylation domain-containing protein/non-ribosomal peptide synthase protein (TIGR01720 family)
VDVPALGRAFSMLAARHPSLRTTFSATADGQLLQTVHPVLEPHFAHVDAQGWSAEQLHAAVVRAYRRPFSLERGPLLRGDLFTSAPDDHVLLITVHHIVYDGWSAGIVQQELSQLYLALSKGAPPSLPPVAGTYADFVARHQELVAGAAGRAHWDYWQKKLAGELPVLTLPTDRTRSSQTDNRSGAVALRLDPGLTAALKALAQSEGATPFVALLAAYAALLGRLARQDDLLIGSPTTGRTGAAVHDVVGYCANPVVLRADLSGAPSSRVLIARLREVVFDALAHQEFPFATLVERLEVERRPGLSPIFQASMTFQSSREGGAAMDLWATPDEEARIRWGHIELEPYPLKDQEGQFDLTLEIWEARGAFAGALRFNRGLFDEATVRLWRGYLQTLLEEMVRAPDQSVASLALVDAVEAPAPVAAPAAEPAAGTTITAWFERQVDKTPDAVALSFGETHLSYAELNARANLVAYELQDRGVGPESLVGVCVERSAELVIAILGVLKAGGAYVPLDPASPRERLALILEDAAVTSLVTESRRECDLPTSTVPTVYVDTLRWAEGRRAPNPRPELRPEHAAYVIYTSGSTGRPKGVIVTHHNATRLFTTTESPLFDFGPQDVWTLFHSAAFDFSVWELWGPLFYGGRLVVIPHWMTRSPDAMADLIAREGVTVLNQTPSAFRALMRAPAIADGVGGRTLRWIIFGGEALDAATVRPWFERYADASTVLVNMYGITETTVHVTYHRVTEADLASSASPIGRSLPDLDIRLLDEHGRPVPVGVPGEMFVGGAGVARGYLKRPELTAQRFVPDPSAPGKTLYRSGDLAIRLADGNYNYLGRIDDQVKIRGFRIELGEIQSLIAEHPAVAEAYVTTYERGEDDKRIVAYVVPREGASDLVLTEAPCAAPSGDGIGETHVGEWKQLYDELYARSADTPETDDTFNIAGWNSSYTGAALSATAMKEWVDHTVRQVLERAPSRVLEIGCGTGLLLVRIAPHTTAYWGTDVSNVVVDMVGRFAARTQGLGHVKLFHAAADELDRVPFGAERFDAVVINSVVQYFPSGEYLAQALVAAAERVSPGGFIFVGDVRNLRLLEAFHASILLAQSRGALDPRALRERVARRMAGEEELVLDPDFFWGLRQRIPRLTHVEVRPKRGVCRNELTRFRYDVLLHLDTPPVAVTDVVWGPGNVSLLELRARLGQPGGAPLGLRGVPNARLQAPVEAAALLHDPPASPVGFLEKLRRRVSDHDGASAAADPEPGLDPEELHQLAEALSLEVALDWSRGGADGSFDAVFRRPVAASPAASPPTALFGVAPDRRAQRRANDPLRGRLERRMEGELRRRAQERLPDYMVPASIMVIDKVPLTGNGKVDRRALPVPAAPHDLEVAHVDPRTGEEEILASVFAELLGAERVGVHESFFDLGGHSLLATQVVSRIRTVFGVDLPLRTLFDAPTVAGLGAAVQQLRARAAAALPDLTAPVERVAPLPLSSAQERMWILDRIEETRSPIYVIPLLLRLRGALQAGALRASLETIVRRHEALRTSFPLAGESPVQSIADDLTVDLPPAEDLVHPPGTTEAELLALVRRQAGLEVSRPFDLARGPLLRARLFRIADADHVLVLTMHHIVSDGWSVGVLSRELATCYNALHSGREPSLPALPIQYADFAVWQRRLLAEGALAETIRACAARLAGAPGSLDLPADRPRPSAPSFQGGLVRFAIDRSLTRRLKDLSRREGVTLYMTLLAAYAGYLARLSGQKDLVLGSPVANRNRAATEPLIGLFVNTLPLRLDLSGDPTFLELLGRVRRTTLDAYAEQDVPFEKVVEALTPERSLNRQPLVQAMFVLQNAPFTPPALDGLSVELIDLDSVTAKFDLTLSMQETADGLLALLEYSSELFDRERIERMARHLSTLLRSVADRPEQRCRDLEVLDAAEAEALQAWSAGPAAPPSPASVLDLFAAGVARDPDAVAVESGATTLRYGDLDRRATELARHLKRLGVGPEVRVALLLPRSIEAIVAVLAVWKAGGAYVPVDPEYPRARIDHMLEDSQAALLLTLRSLGTPPAFEGRTVWLDEEVPEAGDVALPMPAPGSLAYVIYTSGSTGKPKGALLEHGALANVAVVQHQLFETGPGRAVLQFASLSFDASVWEIAMALGSGGRLVLCADETTRAGEGLATLLTERRVTHATLPPSTLAALPDRPFPDLRVVVSAGEACTRELARKWIAPDRRFYNAYGPTESTICATIEEASAEEPGVLTIGRPLPGLVVRILDADQGLAPVGVPGELCVGGAGVGRGYHGLEALTRERFIPDAFAGEAAARLYRTGDLARWRADGKIEYLGRLDHQVKLRGYRIELGEVEAVLESHPAVQQALALVHRNQLAAYVTAKKGAKLTVEAVREHALGRLPQSMVPAWWRVLDEFPLTPNGKIDRKRLPSPEDAAERAAFAAPRTPAEERLAAIWASVLKQARIGIHDNFFTLGGDSILGLQIIARAAQEGLRLRPRQIFEHQTIAELARAASAAQVIQAEQGAVEGGAPLTPIQQWFFARNLAEPAHFNMAMLLDVDPGLDPDVMRGALAAVERHHDALRLRFRREGGQWSQHHVAPAGIPLEELAADGGLEPALARLHRGLDLEQGPVLRAALLHLGKDAARLALIAHHLVVDAVSWGVLLEDLLTAYDQLARGGSAALPPKTTSFQQWSRRLEQYADTPDARAELDAWLAAADRDASHEFPLNDASAPDTVGEAASITTWLEEDQAQALLSEVPGAYDVRVNEALVAALARCLAGFTGHPSVRIDLEGHGRESPFDDVDLSRTIGWFTALYPLRLRVGAREGERDTLARVKDALRSIPRGGLGHGILRYLSPDASIRARLAGVGPAPVVFNYLGPLGTVPAHGVVRGSAREGHGPLHSPLATRPHRIEVTAVVEPGPRLRVNWTFGAEVFRPETIERLGASFLAALRSLVRGRQQPQAAVRVAADFPVARLSARDLRRVLESKKTR